MKKRRTLLTKNIWAIQLKYDPGVVTDKYLPPPPLPISCFEHLFYAKPKQQAQVITNSIYLKEQTANFEKIQATTLHDKRTRPRTNQDNLQA